MLFKLSNLNANLALTLVYLNPALNNSALVSKEANATSGCPYLFSLQVKKLFCASQRTDGNWCSSFHLTLKAMLHRRICNDYFSATQRCNAVAILFRNVSTLFRHGCPKNRRCKSSRVTSPGHFWEHPKSRNSFIPILWWDYLSL